MCRDPVMPGDVKDRPRLRAGGIRPAGALSASVALALLASATAMKAAPDEPAGADPDARNLLLVDPGRLGETRRRLKAGDARLRAALDDLRRRADRALTAGCFSVMDKAQTPPSGDKHDYMSVGPYWWPDRRKSDGLPYVRRDGQVNPERTSVGDLAALRGMTDSVITLARTYALTGREAHAARAAMGLRAWFLDPATRMNPNMKYAQAIPGRCDGRGIGIVDTARWVYLIDAIGLIGASKAWTPADLKAMRAWFAAYLTWLRESRHGKSESRAGNNHGTQYDAQVACCALFTGREEIARRILEAAKRRRIAAQVLPDGRQPAELKRTKSWDYSCYNLQHLFNLALLGERVGVDLWRYESRDGRSIRKALDFLLPSATGEKTWRRRQIVPFRRGRPFRELRLAAMRYDEPRYEAAVRELPPAARRSADALLYPSTRPARP